jgi:hypothetical protein
MAPDVAKVDADRDLNLGLPAWDFSDEVLRVVLFFIRNTFPGWAALSCAGRIGLWETESRLDARMNQSPLRLVEGTVLSPFES